MDLSPTQVGSLAQYLGALGVLALAMVAFLKDWVMTRATSDRLVAAAVSASKDTVERLSRENDELRRTNDLLREVTHQTAGSSVVQASTVADAMTAMTALAIELRGRAGAPALPAGGAP